MTAKTIKIAIAPDSFKGTMTALEAAASIERGLRKELTKLSVRKIPMADGGEGTVQAVVDATKGTGIAGAKIMAMGRRDTGLGQAQADEKHARNRRTDQGSSP